MDVPREGHARRKRLKRAIYLILLSAGLGALTWAFSRLEPALPSVERASVWMGEVERGSMLLADEPTGNLDSENGAAVMQLLSNLHRDGATIGMVTHDPRYAKYAERRSGFLMAGS